MKLDQEFWNALHPKVRAILKHTAEYPTERNVCYAYGYIKGAQDFGGLLSHHYSFLVKVLEGANNLNIIKEFHRAS